MSRGRVLRHPATALLAVLVAAACAPVGPDYQAPPPEVPPVYSAPVPDLFVDAAPLARWWQVFDDPVLDRVMTAALAGNLNIRIAESRVREAQAIARGADAELSPSLDAGGEVGLERREESDDDDNTTGATALAGLDTLWDLDLFGGLERGSQAAWARAEAEAALEREARRVTAQAVATAYLDLRTAQARLALTDSALDQEAAVRDLVDQRVQAGLAPALDLVRAEAAVATLEADVGPLLAEVARNANALAVLSGEPPGSFNALKAENGTVPRAATGAPVGVPLDLLRCRPDVQAAELEIMAATADIGVATAALYPRLTLPGSLSIGVDGLASADVVTTVIAAISLAIDIPLLDGGARQANLDAAEERALQATLAWRDTVLAAIEQTEAALEDHEAARRRSAALHHAEEKGRQAYEQSQALYREGLATFIDVLDSQRTWIATQQQEALARRSLALAQVELYSAVGCLGPWSE